MDISGIIVVILGVLLFFGGVAWLEIRSRKNNRPVRQEGHAPQSADSKTSAKRTEYRRTGTTS